MQSTSNPAWRFSPRASRARRCVAQATNGVDAQKVPAQHATKAPTGEAAHPTHAATSGRRHVLAAAAALLAVSPWAAAPQAAAAGASAGPSKSSFYAEYPYVTPEDILPYLRATATPGDIDSVLAAIDRFAEFYPMYRCGPEKGAFLEQLVAQHQPALALELGTFMAYGAMRVFRQLPPGGRLVSVEASQEQAGVARQVLEFAGVPVGEGPEARVQVVNGLSGEVLPRMRQLAALKPGEAASFVFLDHCKKCYLPDLLAMERLVLVGPGSLIVADNVLIPGAPDYLQHVGASIFGGPGSTKGGAAGGSSGGSSGGRKGDGSGGSGGEEGGVSYRTELNYTLYEVEGYGQDWKPQQDAMAVSRCV